jgi:hypothetical protein
VIRVPFCEVERLRKENILASQKNNPASAYMKIYMAGKKAGNHSPHGFSNLCDKMEMRKRNSLTKAIYSASPERMALIPTTIKY